MTSPALPDWIPVLSRCGEELPAWLVAHVRAVGAPARATLVALLREAQPPEDPVEPEDFVGEHAAELLAHFEPDDELVQLCLDRIHEEPGGPLTFSLVDLLVRFGPRVAPAVLDARRRLGPLDHDEGMALCCVLARCGARDEVVFEALMDGLRRRPADVCALMGHYGDVRAIGPLLELLDSHSRPDDLTLVEATLVDDLVFGVRTAVAMLGGELSEEQQLKVEEATAFRDRIGLDELLDADPRPTPNAPCWCDSGRKYKKCHMAQDQREDGWDGRFRLV